jgi:FMN reductase
MLPPPLIVGLGGTTRAGSTSERALAVALEAAAAAGCETRLFGAGAMPHARWSTRCATPTAW